MRYLIYCLFVLPVLAYGQQASISSFATPRSKLGATGKNRELVAAIRTETARFFPSENDTTRRMHNLFDNALVNRNLLFPSLKERLAGLAKDKSTGKAVRAVFDSVLQNNADTSSAENNGAGDVAQFFATAALSGGNTATDLASSFTATGRIMASFKILAGLHFDIAANLLNVNPASVKKDSVDFKSLMFPETGNFGVLVSPFYSFTPFKNYPDISVVPFYEFAYRRFSIDSPAVSFKVFNHTVGARFEWRHQSQDGKNSVTVGLSVYKHGFLIPQEDVMKFTTSLVNDSLFSKVAVRDNNVSIRSFGCKLTVLYNNFLFFADFRKNNNTVLLADNDPFKGTAVNIGFATIFKIGSF